MQLGAECGHNNIQTESIKGVRVLIDNSGTVYLVMHCMFYITRVTF